MAPNLSQKHQALKSLKLLHHTCPQEHHRWMTHRNCHRQHKTPRWHFSIKWLRSIHRPMKIWKMEQISIIWKIWSLRKKTTLHLSYWNACNCAHQFSVRCHWVFFEMFPVWFVCFILHSEKKRDQLKMKLSNEWIKQRKVFGHKPVPHWNM